MDKTKLSCLVANSVHTADTDTRQCCPCWQSEWSISGIRLEKDWPAVWHCDCVMLAHATACMTNDYAHIEAHIHE